MRTVSLWRDPRLQSLMVIAVLVLGSLVVLADALSNWRAEAQALSTYEERTGLLEQKAAGITSPQVDPTAQEPGEGTVLIDAQTTGLVSAEFQRLLSRRAERAGAVVRSVDVPEDALLTTENEPAPESVERVRLTADIEVMEQALPDLLYAIEAGSPVMVIDAFTLRLNRKVDVLGGDTSASAAMDRPLSLSLTLSAFRQKGPQS